MSDTIIEPLLLSEVALILPIERACHAFASSEKLLESCFSKRYHNFKLLCRGKLAGFYMAELILDEMTLHNICVDPAYQGKGFGKMLFEHFVAQARSLSVVQLWLEVRPSNEPAVNLYQNSGFDIVGTRKDYYPSHNGREDALLMGCTLADALN